MRGEPNIIGVVAQQGFVEADGEESGFHAGGAKDGKLCHRRALDSEHPCELTG